MKRLEDKIEEILLKYGVNDKLKDITTEIIKLLHVNPVEVKEEVSKVLYETREYSQKEMDDIADEVCNKSEGKTNKEIFTILSEFNELRYRLIVEIGQSFSFDNKRLENLMEKTYSKPNSSFDKEDYKND